MKLLITKGLFQKRKELYDFVIKMSANNKNFYKYWAVTDCLDCVIC